MDSGRRRIATEGLLPLHQGPSLSDETITKILLCLPIKPLFRFKSVSKGWRRLISAPSFVRSYQSRNGPPTLAGFFSHFHSTPTFIPSNISAEAEKLIRPIPSRHYCLASSDGLALLSTAASDYVVWNPVTGASSPIPKPRSRSIELTGFVTDIGSGRSSTPSEPPPLSYKVVVVSHVALEWEAPMASPFPKTDTLRIETFSSDTGRWAMSAGKLPRPIHFIPDTSKGVVASDGILYWLDYNLMLGGDAYSVVAYDTKEERMEVIGLPPGCPNEWGYSDCSLHRGFDGGVGLCKKTGSEISIWALSDGEAAWSLECRVRFGFLDRHFFEIVCLCAGQQGRRVVYVRWEGKLVRCCVDDRRGEAFGDAAAEGSRMIPLMLPPWPLPLPKI